MECHVRASLHLSAPEYLPFTLFTTIFVHFYVLCVGRSCVRVCMYICLYVCVRIGKEIPDRPLKLQEYKRNLLLYNTVEA